MKKEICGTFHAKCGTAGFDVSFRDCLNLRYLLVITVTQSNIM
jgi:hypothetical protein